MGGVIIVINTLMVTVYEKQLLVLFTKKVKVGESKVAENS